ncbi:MAG: hypothetical protein M3Y60_12750, partial [Bacteroidota bacterium]|nr:hypothetical protein [Bacteroidota bacterium]
GNQGQWMSTQETAMCLRAVSLFAGKQKGGDLKFDYTLAGGKKITASTGLPIAQIPIPVSGVRKYDVSVDNKSQGMVFVRVIATGTPARGNDTDESNNLSMSIRYTDAAGNVIDPSALQQGTQFVAEVSVRHPGYRQAYENLALSQVFPSGWEINNLRLNDDEAFLKTGQFAYQDIRDDRVFTYFDLAPQEEKTFRISLTASFAGSYYLPGASCQTMYDPGIYARKKGQEVAITKGTP